MVIVTITDFVEFRQNLFVITMCLPGVIQQIEALGESANDVSIFCPTEISIHPQNPKEILITIDLMWNSELTTDKTIRALAEAACEDIKGLIPNVLVRCVVRTFYGLHCSASG